MVNELPAAGPAPRTGDAGQPIDDQLAHCARTVAHLSRGLERSLADVDLTLPQYRLLSLLAEGSSAGGVLAGRLAVSPPSITAVVDGLVERGLVERRHDAADRRRIAHDLTPTGLAALQAGDQAAGAHLVELASFLPPTRRRQALGGLADWQDALKAGFAHRKERTPR